MKKSILFSLVLVFFIFQGLSAKQADLFSYDQTAIEEEFAQLEELENHVAAHQGMTLADLEAGQDGTSVVHKLNYASPSKPMFGIEDMDWGSFAWGFCCCPIGFFTVAINKNKTSEQKLSYWIGVGVSAVLSAISNAVAYSGGYYSYY